MSDALDTWMGECEAKTQRHERCLRIARHVSPVLRVKPNRRLELCTQHWHIFQQAERQGGPDYAHSLAGSWVS